MVTAVRRVFDGAPMLITPQRRHRGNDEGRQPMGDAGSGAAVLHGPLRDIAPPLPTPATP